MQSLLLNLFNQSNLLKLTWNY